MMAHGLAGAGCAVLLAARRQERLDGVAAAIEASGGRAAACRADLRDPAHAARLVAAAREAFGRLDGVVLNAATSTIGPARRRTRRLSMTLRVNVGARGAGQRGGPGDDRRRGGRLDDPRARSSAQAHRPVAAYAASKIANEAHRELARQWAPHIRVNALAPGYFPGNERPMTADPPPRGLVARIPWAVRRAADIAGRRSSWPAGPPATSPARCCPSTGA
jgi:NAD(P)-dependent dehydrogenase (short-subunit alcohol dehydrogenase family)